MARAREACPSCSLPFYTDTNDECPYCSTPVTGPDDARAAPGRTRTTCPDCGLPHYGDDCPYCERAASAGGETADADPGDGGASEAESASPPESAPEPEPSDETGTSEESSGEAPTAEGRTDTGDAGVGADKDDEGDDDGPNTFLGRLSRLLFGR